MESVQNHRIFYPLDLHYAFDNPYTLKALSSVPQVEAREKAGDAVPLSTPELVNCTTHLHKKALVKKTRRLRRN